MDNKELPKRYIDEKTGIEYRLVGDYYLPNLVLTGSEKRIKLGKYGRMRLQFLKNNKKAEYTILLMDNKLQKHLIDIDTTANARLKLIIKQMVKKENITENLKANNQMEWVSRMNNIKNCAEEIISKELIYI